MAFRYLRFAASLCAVVAGCATSFLCGYCAGYREALNEWYFEPSIVIRDEHAQRTVLPTEPEFKAYRQTR